MSEQNTAAELVKTRAALRLAVLALDAYAGEEITIGRDEGPDADACETLREIAVLLGLDGDVEMLVEAMLPEGAT